MRRLPETAALPNGLRRLNLQHPGPEHAKPTQILPRTTAAFPQHPLLFPGVVKLEISIVQYRHTTKLKNRSSLNFSFLFFAFLVLGFETRNLMAQFYGSERKALL